MRNFLFISALLACAASVSHAQSTASFRVDKIESDKACRIVATNKNIAPITVTAEIAKGALQYQYRSDRTWPLQEVVAPNSTHEIAKIFMKEENREPCRMEMAYSYSIGNAFIVPDRHYKYRLPFEKNTIVRVTQEPGGILTTHKDALSRYAVDFSVPIGTPVLAAREGTVIEIRDNFNEGRTDPKLVEKANFISIMHSDGTYAQYVHLAQHSLLVLPGQWVETGQMIGKSGSTGYTGGPHLHFDLRRAHIGADGIVRQESLPFSFFRWRSGEKITLKQWRQITVD